MRTLIFLVAAASLAAQSIDVDSALKRPLLDPKQPQVEVQVYTASRVPLLPTFDDAAKWRDYSTRLRQRILDEIVLRGEARRWSQARGRVEWLDVIQGSGYRIRKLRYEAVPGVWSPALLYEPDKIAGRVPVALNVNGHEKEGVSRDYIQARCINLAKKGVPALNVEWLGRGQLSTDGFNHNLMPQIDLTGTSGLAVHFLSMRRAVDILIEQPYTDPQRIALTGLSGGGWQTIILASLDPRIAVAAPVAGYSSFVTRSQFPELDLGDPEQTPSDLATIADYTHLTALLAPRPAVLIYNAKDNCCFRADYSFGPLLQFARPVYALLGAADKLTYHVNYSPGHNYDADNRQAFYRLVSDHLFAGKWSTEDLPVESEIRSAEQLRVPMPENGDFHTLARDLARSLPRTQNPGSERLREIVRYRDLSVTAKQAASKAGATFWRLKMGDAWTVPAVEIAPAQAKSTVIVVADAGRASVANEIRALLADGKRVVAMDPFYFGESKIASRDYLFALLVAALGERPLGIQASQVAATARWLHNDRKLGPVSLLAVGPRSSLFALIAGALDPAISAVDTRGGLSSLKDIIESNYTADKTPEFFCFGLLESFDIPQIRALGQNRK